MTFQEQATGHLFHSVTMMIHLPPAHAIFNGLTKKQSKRVRHKLRGCRSTSKSQRVFDMANQYADLNQRIAAMKAAKSACSGGNA